MIERVFRDAMPECYPWMRLPPATGMLSRHHLIYDHVFAWSLFLALLFMSGKNKLTPHLSADPIHCRMEAGPCAGGHPCEHPSPVRHRFFPSTPH